MKFCVSPLEEKKKDKNQFSISKPTISCSLLSINEKNLLLGLAHAKEKRCENTNYLKYSKNHVEWFRKNIQWFQFKFHASTIFHWIRCYLTCTQRHPRNYCKRAALWKSVEPTEICVSSWHFHADIFFYIRNTWNVFNKLDLYFLLTFAHFWKSAFLHCSWILELTTRFPFVCAL